MARDFSLYDLEKEELCKGMVWGRIKGERARALVRVYWGAGPKQSGQRMTGLF